MSDYLLDPPDHSYEDYIREKVEERSEEIATLIEQSDFPSWFNECINWDEVEAKLWDEVEKELQNEMDNQAIERWEERQQHNENLW